MTIFRLRLTVARTLGIATVLASTGNVTGVASFAQSPASKPAKVVSPTKLVAYDAKDKRYYSVAWAKAHGMKDKGGDKLVIVPRSKLPKDARLSHAMKGIEP